MKQFTFLFLLLVSFKSFSSEAYCSINPYASSCSSSDAYCESNPYASSCSSSDAYCESNPYASSCQ